MTKQPLISVVIPVYNAEATLERCISVLRETEEPIEVICVDDGSRDGSGALLDRFAREDARIRVFHTENRGAGAARNYALARAVGEYIMFCDADDAYAENTLNCIAQDIRELSPDYIVFRRISRNLQGKELDWGVPRERRTLSCGWEEYLNNIINAEGHGTGIWTKVFRRALVEQHQVRFSEDMLYGEDLWFVLCYLPYARSFVEDYRAVYHQVAVEGSICHTPRTNFYQLNTRCLREYQRVFPERAEKLEAFFDQFYFSSGVLAFRRMLCGQDEKDPKEKQKRLEQVQRDALFRKGARYVARYGIDPYYRKKARWITAFGWRGYWFRFRFLPDVRERLTLL